MTPEKKVKYDEQLGRARDYVVALEQGREQEADQILVQIANMRETMLFQQIGKLTRQLHDSMESFSLDAKFSELTEKEIPDAKERLNYVISMTQQAADTTLNAIEEIIPLSENLQGKAQDLDQKWVRFRNKEMPLSEFKELSSDLADYFSHSTVSLKEIHASLNEVLMAQGFQDITGQIIKRVINLVQDVELSMVELIRISGGNLVASEAPSSSVKPELAGPAIPSLNETDQMESQDDVDDLLSSLGF